MVEVTYWEGHSYIGQMPCQPDQWTDPNKKHLFSLHIFPKDFDYGIIFTVKFRYNVDPNVVAINWITILEKNNATFANEENVPC